MNYQDAIKTGKELHAANYAKGLGTEEYGMCGIDLRNRGVSGHTDLESVPLNKQVSTLYAIEVISPAGDKKIYAGDYNQPLSAWIGAKLNLDNAHNTGVVIGIKNLWDGKISRMATNG